MFFMYSFLKSQRDHLSCSSVNFVNAISCFLDCPLQKIIWISKASSTVKLFGFPAGKKKQQLAGNLLQLSKINSGTSHPTYVSISTRGGGGADFRVPAQSSLAGNRHGPPPHWLPNTNRLASGWALYDVYARRSRRRMSGVGRKANTPPLKTKRPRLGPWVSDSCGV